jgi:IS30 family transposase
VNNRCGLSQRKLGRRFKVHHSTISRTLRKRTSVVIRKRRKAPKMNSEDQENRARKNRGKMYRKLLSGYDLILDDEKML